MDLSSSIKRQGPLDSKIPIMTRLRGILTSTVLGGEWRTWGLKTTTVVVRQFGKRTIPSIDFAQRSGYKQNYRPKNAHSGQGTNVVAMDGVSLARLHWFGFCAEDGGRQIQRAGRMRVQQLSRKHPAQTDHT